MRSAWQEFDCYKVLEIARSATPADVRKAYYVASKRAHPDAGGSHDAQVRVNRAYAILSDPVSRQAHDLFWFGSLRSWTTTVETPPRRPRPEAPPVEPREAEVRRTRGLDAFVARVQARVAGEREKIRLLSNRNATMTASQYERRYYAGRARRHARLVAAVALSDLAMVGSTVGFHLGWVTTSVAWLMVGVTSGVRIGSHRVRFRDREWRTKIWAIADREAEAVARVEEAGLDKFNRYVASLTELVGRSTTVKDTEDQVARRITATLFLMGYQPVAYDRELRILVFTDGGERLLVRFRHRSGVATNVTYVEQMIGLMKQWEALRGILFCTPGLSGNGAALAAQHAITSYSLGQMNTWTSSVLDSSYSGPASYVLEHLEQLILFLGQIAVPLPYRRP